MTAGPARMTAAPMATAPEPVPPVPPMAMAMATATATAEMAAQPEVRRHTGSVTRAGVLAIGGAAAAAAGLTSVLFTQILPWSGALSVVVVWYVLFLISYALLISLDEPGPIIRDRVAAVAIHSLALVLLAALLLVVGYVLVRGQTALRHGNFFSQDLSDAGPLDPLPIGGVLHGVVGTLEQITIALVFVIPIGLACAVFLNEVPGPLARFTRTIAEAMTALPSIVAGLFIYVTLVLILGLNKCGFAAATALSLMMLPIIVRAADVVLRLVPGALREASLALGAGQFRTVWHVVLPTARSGLATAVILGTARGIGETSPVLLTAGYTKAMNSDPLHGPQVSLPLLAFTLVRSGVPNMVARGFGAGAVLLALVLLLFVVARAVGGRGPGQLSRRQQRRRAAASRRDVDRRAQRDLRQAADHPVPAFDPTPVPAAEAR